MEYNDRQVSPTPPICSEEPVTPPTTAPAPEPAPDRPDFVVDTVTDAGAIRGVIGALISPAFTVGYWVLGILCLVLGLLLILLDGRPDILSVLCLALGVAICILRLMIPRRVAEKQLKLLRESYGGESVPLQLVFWPQGLVVNNKLSGGHVNFRYDLIRRLICKNGYLALVTTAGQSVILPLADVANQPDFLPYLLAKCSQAKKKGL